MMFSVVLCTYNRAASVATAVKAVLAQSWDDFELIVVDDGSTDHTGDVLAGFDDRRLRLVRRPNGGLSAARNTGIAEARGRFVAMVDDDDIVSPAWLAGLAAGVNDATGFTACTCTLVSPDRTRSVEVPSRPHGIFTEIRGVFMAGTFALDRSVLVDTGGYAEQIRVSHQTELLLRALPLMRERGMTAVLIDEPLIDIERRQAGDRPLSQPADLRHGAEYLIEHHRPLLATRPRALANYYAIAGASAAQLGDHGRARRHLLLAARTYPRDPKHLVRAVVSMVPPLARRTWRRPAQG
jgi:glycosyltransferase involved in cell wall biosynthesis